MVERGHGRPHRGWLDWRQGTRKIPPVPQAWGGGSGAAADGGAIAASQPLHHPADGPPPHALRAQGGSIRSEEHTSELQSLMRNSYAVFCLKKKKKNTT